jgi:uncharacterized phiE125 gp8 family phage protein
MGNDRYEVTVPAAEEPVTLSEVKSWCKITHSSEDALLTALIKAAVSKSELFTNRVFIQRTFTGFFSTLECSKFEKGLFFTIRRAPLLSVSAMEVTEDDSQAAVSTDDYNVKKTAGFSRVIFSELNNSPDLIPYPWQIEFVAGYGAASDVPEPLKVAIKAAVCYWYSNKGDCADTKELPGISRMILSEYRIVNTFGC